MQGEKVQHTLDARLEEVAAGWLAPGVPLAVLLKTSFATVLAAPLLSPTPLRLRPLEA